MGAAERVDEAVAEARQAAGDGRARAAYELLLGVEADLDAEGLARLAEVAYIVGDVATTFEAWERVYDRAVRADEPVVAAGAATQVAMHLLMDTGLLAPVRMWVKRAERLLGGLDTTPVDAALAVAHGYERLLSGDLVASLEWARRAIELGTVHEAAAPVALARVMEARGVLFTDDVTAGLDLLDESAAGTTSGEVDPLSVGLVYCELVCAWQGLSQHERAETLTAEMERWCEHHPDLGSVHGRCRVHRAELLRVRGDLAAAQTEAEAACEELRPYLRREFGWPLTELGTIRLRQGDLAGARSAFLEAHGAGWDPQPGLALLCLQEGDATTAASMVDQALERPLGIPSKELPPDTALRRAPLLAAQVQVSVATGRLEVARRAARDLAEVAATYTSPALEADAALAAGTIEFADGNLADARRADQRALALYSDLAMPYEAARARLGLADAHRAEGASQLATLEADAAQQTLRQIGAVAPSHPAIDESAPGHDSGEPGRPASADGSRAAVSHLLPEGDHISLSFEGRTVRLRDLKGLRYLARLLAEPGREFHALDLVTAEEGMSAGPSRPAEPDVAHPEGDLGPALDERAKAAYRRRLRDIDEDLDEARSMGDAERAARAEVERDFLVGELARAVGLGGRDRPTGAAAERARVSVTRAVRYALRRVHEHHPELGAHLDHAVRTGTYLAYDPDPQSTVRWEVPR